MDKSILKVENLKKSYGELVAVNNISFEVKEGQFFAFLGRNGAGKSTTIKILTTLLKQDSGKFYFDGKDNEQYMRENIGIVFQENVLDPFLTVKENLMLRGHLLKLSKEEIAKKYDELKTQFELVEFENKQARFLSGGQSRRAELARALFANPRLLFLDEPTAGLDAESRKVLWNILQTLQKEKQTTIFLTTHYMEETNNADYVVILDKGEIVSSGTPTELKEKFAKDIFKVSPKNKKSFEEYLKEKQMAFKKVADNYVILVENSQLALQVLVDNKENIKQFELVKGSMDDVFLAVTKGGGNE